jgi:hypothetical protein
VARLRDGGRRFRHPHPNGTPVARRASNQHACGLARKQVRRKCKNKPTSNIETSGPGSAARRTSESGGVQKQTHYGSRRLIAEMTKQSQIIEENPGLWRARRALQAPPSRMARRCRRNESARHRSPTRGRGGDESAKTNPLRGIPDAQRCDQFDLSTRRR